MNREAPLILYAPSEAKIIGIRLRDGSVSPFEYTYHKDSSTCMYVLPSGSVAQLPDPIMLVDERGKDWTSTDVEYHTLFLRR
jgi:hypothetical protein